MEGLVDDVMRDILTSIGGVDWCVTEFVRVTDSLLPARSFRRICSELEHGCRTPAGTRVHLQLLGSDPHCLAENAARAAEMGVPVIDLNFGCPARSVNRHRGGAILLQEPELLYRIVATVRAAVPHAVPITAKMRIGYLDSTQALDCALALMNGGIGELAVHARTKADGYRPPAYWEWIARIREIVHIPVVANGEIWTFADYQRCREISGCQDVMLGRGLIACPDLAWQIRSGGQLRRRTWQQMLPWLRDFYLKVTHKVVPQHCPGRLKQWLTYLAREYPEAGDLHRVLRAENNVATVLQILDRHLLEAEPV